MKELDFLPQSFHEAVRQRRQLRRNILSSIGLLIALGSLHVVNQERIRTAEACLSTLHSGSGSFENARLLIDSLRVRKDLLAQRAALLDRLEDGTPLDAIMGEISRLMGDPMAIRTLEITAKRPADQQTGAGSPNRPRNTNDQTQQNSAVPIPGPIEVRLTAVAANDMEIGIFLGRLSTCPLFEDIRMVFSQETQDEQQPMREFQLTFTVKRVEIES
jgi:hypothetical protein